MLALRLHKMKHPGFFFPPFVHRAALVAISNTILTPSLVFAEHSTYPKAPMLLTKSLRCSSFTSSCFLLANSSLMCLSFLRSFLLPTRMMGTLRQKCLISDVHFWSQSYQGCQWRNTKGGHQCPDRRGVSGDHNLLVQLCPTGPTPPVSHPLRYQPHSFQTLWERKPQEIGPCWRRWASMSFHKLPLPRSPVSSWWMPLLRLLLLLYKAPGTSRSTGWQTTRRQADYCGGGCLSRVTTSEVQHSRRWQTLEFTSWRRC